jgi:hypothetical protein
MERESYSPSENMNQYMSLEEQRLFKEHMEGLDDISFVIDENGNRVQVDRPVPEDEFDQRRREVEGR